MSLKESEKDWQNYAFRVLFSTAAHPIEYAKVLIQIGYEPIAPQPGTTFFGKPALKLPNVFQYVRYIKSVDGYVGCYRGLAPKLCGNIASAIATRKVLISLVHEIEETAQTREETEYDKFIKSLKKDVVTRFTAVLVSHPFQVISIRMMAQFVGGEKTYNGLFGSIAETYRESGVLGFFSGFIPRLLGEIISILLANTLTFAVNNYVLHDVDLKMYSAATMSFIASAFTYPFHVVSVCMSVSGTGLVAGNPPHMPVYTSWLDCWSNLSEHNQLKRGSSLLRRYYLGPQVVIDGVAMPILKPKRDII